MNYPLPDPIEPDEDCPTRCDHCGIAADFTVYEPWHIHDSAPIYNAPSGEILCEACWQEDLEYCKSEGIDFATGDPV